MSSDPTLLAPTLRAEVERRLQDRTLPLGMAIRPRDTLGVGNVGDSGGQRAIELLRRVGAPGGLEVMATIAEGGMGIVRAARQLSVGREVALKTVREATSDPMATLKLLREAWITGALEHPNVVPIYDVSLDSAGRPQILLKKISGAPWVELLGRPDEVRRRFGAEDVLDWHLRTLIQVANALGFAHSRGIVHRDVKPDNVMVGEFGEVYVLDWGIAVSLVDDGSGRLPLAVDALEIAGTPAYMAPEMLGGEHGRLGVRTDVYLLGSVLFEIIDGRPPHDGGDLAAIIRQVLDSPRELPESTPEELVRIVRKAMAFEPSERFEDAQAFRSALTQFLEHRGSLALTEDADERLRALNDALMREDDDGGERRVRVYRVFAEARMGYLQALRAWPCNDGAKQGLRRAVTSMIAYELGAADARAASLLLSELPDVDAELQARVEAARQEQERDERRRLELEADLDPEEGRHARFVVSAVLCAVWTVTPFVTWSLEIAGTYHRTYGDAVLSSVLGITVAAGLGYWARAALSRTAVNRRLRATVAIALGGQIVLYLAAWVLGIEFWSTVALKFLLYCVAMAHVAVSVNRRFWFTVVGYLAAFTCACAWPKHGFLFEGLANLSLMITVVALWGRRRAPHERRPVTAWSGHSRDV